jgi:hypothetical protein
MITNILLSKHSKTIIFDTSLHGMKQNDNIVSKEIVLVVYEGRLLDLHL